MSRIAAGIVFAMTPGVILAVSLLLGGCRAELAAIAGGGIALAGWDICMRGRRA